MIKKHLPLSMLTLNTHYVLAVLGAHEVGAYGLNKWIEKESRGTVSVGSGNLSRLIKILIAEGYVKAHEDGRHRKYLLTDSGQRRLSRNVGDLEQAVFIGGLGARRGRWSDDAASVIVK